MILGIGLHVILMIKHVCFGIMPEYIMVCYLRISRMLFIKKEIEQIKDLFIADWSIRHQMAVVRHPENLFTAPGRQFNRGNMELLDSRP